MGIITKAAELTKESAIVFGTPASGKSTYVFDKVKAEKTLWIAFGNVGTLTGRPGVENIEVAQPTNYTEFNLEVLPYIRTAKPHNIVFDGVNVMLSMILAQIKPSGPVEQQQWADAGNIIRNAVLAARGESQRVYVIVDAVVDDETKQLKLALNPNTINQLLPLFADKIFTYTTPKKDEKGKVIGVNYAAQTNGARAMRFDKD